MLQASLVAISCCVISTDPPRIQVRLESGRSFAGIVDKRTNAEHLWIRSIYGTAVFLRPIQWERISTVQGAKKEYAPGEFRDLAEQLRLQAPATIWPNGSGGPAAILLAPCLPLVRSLDARARLANWDRDAAPDGIDLCVSPLAEDNRLLPVEGVLQVVAKGYERVPREPVERWSTLARWSEPLGRACYGAEGGAVRLSFRSVPLDPYRVSGKRVLLCVRLTAPGHGVFEAEITMIP